MGNENTTTISSSSDAYIDDFLLDCNYPQFSLAKEEPKGESTQNSNLYNVITDVDQLLKSIMNSTKHTSRIMEKYNSLIVLFEKVHCHVCYLDIAQRWIYQQDYNQLYKFCIELEARIAQQDDSLKKKYIRFCDFAQLNYFNEFGDIPLNIVQTHTNYPGFASFSLLNRTCPKCIEIQELSKTQCAMAAYMVYKAQGILTFYECHWDQIMVECSGAIK
ncbi:hypothetical protein ACR3K2_16560 [Cryptosporidium serpentis]